VSSNVRERPASADYYGARLSPAEAVAWRRASDQLIPLILAHLRRRPDDRVTTGEIGRLLGDRPPHLEATMQRMAHVGLVTRTAERRLDGLVFRWQLNERPRFAPVCSACRERPATVKRRGWCRPCDLRWKRAGKPKDGPPKPSKGGRPRQPETEERVQQTRRLLAQGMGTMEIARTLGVPGSSVCYYKQRLAERGELPELCWQLRQRVPCCAGRPTRRN
jgi:hypothetical protein